MRWSSWVFGEFAVSHQGGPEIGADFRRVGVTGQELAIELDGALHIAGFIGRGGAAQHVFLRATSKCDCKDDAQKPHLR